MKVIKRPFSNKLKTTCKIIQMAIKKTCLLLLLKLFPQKSCNVFLGQIYDKYGPFWTHVHTFYPFSKWRNEEYLDELTKFCPSYFFVQLSGKSCNYLFNVLYQASYLILKLCPQRNLKYEHNIYSLKDQEHTKLWRTAVQEQTMIEMFKKHT